jgi:26S proteasome regulatory subunit N2
MVALAPGGAGGLLALLDEKVEALQVHALRGLLKVVDEHWAEVSSSVSRIESFAEDDAFPQRQLASLLASKVRWGRSRVRSPREP